MGGRHPRNELSFRLSVVPILCLVFNFNLIQKGDHSRGKRIGFCSRDSCENISASPSTHRPVAAALSESEAGGDCVVYSEHMLSRVVQRCGDASIWDVPRDGVRGLLNILFPTPSTFVCYIIHDRDDALVASSAHMLVCCIFWWSGVK